MKSRSRLATVTAAGLMAVGLTLTALNPAAAAGDETISGTGPLKDDWNNEGPFSRSSHSHGNAVAMWQQILWADGYISWGDIDCRFGPTTERATKLWQQKYVGYNEGDGVVGRKTFIAASEVGLQTSGSSAQYLGNERGRYINFYRNGAGDWVMHIGNDAKVLWWDKATFDKCS
ncbi:peptidoglycan-binding protein [Streptomyces roseifaciens]